MPKSAMNTIKIHQNMPRGVCPPIRQSHRQSHRSAPPRKKGMTPRPHHLQSKYSVHKSGTPGTSTAGLVAKADSTSTRIREFLVQHLKPSDKSHNRFNVSAVRDIIALTYHFRHLRLGFSLVLLLCNHSCKDFHYDSVEKAHFLIAESAQKSSLFASAKGIMSHFSSSTIHSAYLLVKPVWELYITKVLMSVHAPLHFSHVIRRLSGCLSQHPGRRMLKAKRQRPGRHLRRVIYSRLALICAFVSSRIASASKPTTSSISALKHSVSLNPSISLARPSMYS